MIKWLKNWFDPFEGSEPLEDPDPAISFLETVFDAQSAHFIENEKFFIVHRGEQKEGWEAVGVELPEDGSYWVEAHPRPTGTAGFVVRQEKLGKYGRRYTRSWAFGKVPLTADSNWRKL